MQIDTSHLDALNQRHFNESQRLAKATGGEQVARKAIVEGIEREIAGERKFLGLPEASNALIDEDALFAELLEMGFQPEGSVSAVGQ